MSETRLQECFPGEPMSVLGITVLFSKKFFKGVILESFLGSLPRCSYTVCEMCLYPFKKKKKIRTALAYFIHRSLICKPANSAVNLVQIS